MRKAQAEQTLSQNKATKEMLKFVTPWHMKFFNHLVQSPALHVNVLSERGDRAGGGDGGRGSWDSGHLVERCPPSLVPAAKTHCIP